MISMFIFDCLVYVWYQKKGDYMLGNISASQNVSIFENIKDLKNLAVSTHHRHSEFDKGSYDTTT